MDLHSYPTRQGERGSAMVEFSLLMIVFIPMLVYSWYLHDVGHHMLDVQETVISATWDYTSRTYEGIDDANKSATSLDNVFHANRFEYLDHTSAYDDYNNLNSTTDQAKYHYELGSKAAWVRGVNLPPGKGQDLGRGSVDYNSWASDYGSTASRQITCAVDPDKDMDWANLGQPCSGGIGMLNPVCAFADSKYARSGVAVCWAKLEVYNYIIPEHFLNGQFASSDMTKDKLEDRSKGQKSGGMADGDVENLVNSDTGLVLKEHASVSFGTWAINNADTNITAQNSKSTATDGDLSYCPSSTNPFYERVAWTFSGGGLGNINTNAIGYTVLYGTMASFMGQALSNQLEIAQAIPMFPGTMDGSPEGFSCPSIAAFEAFAGRPANLSGVNLVARHDRSKSLHQGVLQTSPGWFDFIAMEPGYESSPAQDTNNKYQSAWSNRGQYYMGAQNDNG